MQSNNNTASTLKWLTILILLIAILGISGIAYFQFANKDKQNTGNSINVNLDKVAIINKVQALSRLETVRQTISRDLEIQLDLGDFKVFDFKILENRRTQRFAVTGSVSAGVDLQKISQNNIIIEGEKLTVNVDAAEIFNVTILDDKTALLKDDFSLLFKLQDVLNDTKRRELNEYLQNQAIKQSKVALVNAACENNIISQAKDNAKETIKSLFSNANFKEVVVNIADTQKCEYKEI